MTDIEAIIESRPWTICDIARATQISNQAIYYHMRKNHISPPTHKAGGRKYYTTAEVRQIIEILLERWRGDEKEEK